MQPFVFRHHTGDFALAHNGNLVNSRELVRYLEDKGSLFHSTSDSEILAHLIKKEHSSEHSIFAIIDALNMQFDTIRVKRRKGCPVCGERH